MQVTVSRLQLNKLYSKRWEYPEFKLGSPRCVVDVVNALHELDSLPVEHMVLLAVDTKNKLISTTLAVGDVSSTVISVRTMFQWLLLCDASRFIMAHNHPSGDPSPSSEDIEITRRVILIAKAMGMHLLDHIIIGASDYCSL